MARIVTVYSRSHLPLKMVDMSFIRWVKISEALARCGHEVHLATNEFSSWPSRRAEFFRRYGVRLVSLARLRWADYDVVKTLFHLGFVTLEKYGGANHPFIISKLGSVVGPTDMNGIYFYGASRRRMFDIQVRINHASRYVTVLTHGARDLWRDCFGKQDNLLVVPGAVDAEVPPPGGDPYPGADAWRSQSRPGRIRQLGHILNTTTTPQSVQPTKSEPRCLFAGNIYRRKDQPEANEVLVGKLNCLGAKLAEHGVRLYLLGNGDIDRLDREAVTYLGSVAYEQSWNYLYHAHVGIVLSAGRFMHNNESTKIYHYLRAGLPVISEAGFPNDSVISESGLGTVVPNGDMTLMAQTIINAVRPPFSEQKYAVLLQRNRAAAIRYVLDHHTWDRRAEIYDRVLQRYFSPPSILLGVT